MAIATLSEYKVHAVIAATNTARDPQITQALAVAEAQMERYCGVTDFGLATYTDEAHDGRDEPDITLKNWPVTAVSAVKERMYGTTVTLDSTRYVFNDRGRLTRDGSGYAGLAYTDTPPELGTMVDCSVWRRGNSNVLATYQAGYATIPEDLKQIQFEMVDAILGSAGRDPSIQSESIESYSITLRSSEDKWNDWAMRMDVYRRWP